MKKWALLAISLSIIAIQFVRPQRTNPPEDPAQTLQASTPIDSHTSRILEASCADCHSDRTVWPWYSKVAPASWLVIRDVHEGREKLNYSRWQSYSDPQKSRLLSKMCEEVSGGEMPAAAYLLLHRNAALTHENRQTVCAWASSFRLSAESEED